MTDITRRATLGVLGVGALAGLTASWPRLTGSDIPGRGTDALTVAILGTSQDAAARASIVKAFNVKHPDIAVRIEAIQGADWADFFAKILTMVAAGTPPDVVVVATEGAQLFADRLASPLDPYLKRDAAEMAEYFDDVHPALIESFMYKGSLFQLPVDFNAANMYFNLGALSKAGLEMPGASWTVDDFLSTATAMKKATTGGGPFVSYYWTNRLWGGVVPWLYINNTSFLTEEKSPGGDWMWDRFYAGDPAAKGRSGGYLWEHSNALAEPVEQSFDLLRTIVQEGLGTSPAQGGGNQLVAQFAGGSIGMTPAGGYWVEGLHEAGMTDTKYNVQFFPKWQSQRHQFGASGYAIMRTSKKQDEAWEWVKFCVSKEGMKLAFPTPNTTPTRRSMCNEQLYAGKGPANWKVFYDTLDNFPSAPIPAPPQQAAVETALIKNVSGAVTAGSRAAMRSNLRTLDRDLTSALKIQA